MDSPTTTAGTLIADNQNTPAAGLRGPVLLEDYQLLEILAHQNRERIPELTVHAKGMGRIWNVDGDERDRQRTPERTSFKRIERQLAIFAQPDPAYGDGVRTTLTAHGMLVGASR